MILSGGMSFFTNANNTSIYGGVFTNHIQVIEGENGLSATRLTQLHSYRFMDRWSPITCRLRSLPQLSRAFRSPKCHLHTRRLEKGSAMG